MPSRDALAREADAMKRFAIALTRDVDFAVDLVQDCMERALNKWTLRRSGVPLRAWLFSMMRNLHIDGWRRARRSREEPLDSLANPPELPASQEDHAELNALLARVLTLPEEQRVALVLVAVEGFTYREAARMLGVAEGTIMSRISRARQKLREMHDRTGQRLRSVK